MVLFSNSTGIFLLGVMTGWVIDVNFISAQSFLLTELSPAQGLSAIVAANLAFSIFLSLVHRHIPKLKFSVFGACCAVPFFILVFSLQFPIAGPEVRGLLWLGAAIFGSGLLRWVNEELAMKHLNPGQAKASFFYLASARELGSILGFFTLRFWTDGFSPAQMVQVVAALILAWTLLVVVQFAPRANLEIHYGDSEVPGRPLAGRDARRFVAFFLLMMFFLGLYHLGQEYLMMMALQTHLTSFEALKDVQAEYYLVASLLIVGLGPVAARWIQARRSSPLSLIFLHGACMLLLLGACWVHPVFLAFVALEVGEVVSKSVVGEPAFQMIYASFSAGGRNRLRSWGVFFLQSLAGVPLLLLLPWVSGLEGGFQVRFWLVLAAISMVAGLLWAWRARGSLVSALYGLFRSEDRESAILAAQALSYLRPRDFTERMEEVLAGDPRKLLRKTIIVGLAYSREAKALDAVIREFQSDKEEIQLAVLDALKVFRSYRALQFVVDVMNGRATSKSLQVRVNAARLIGAIYGKKAIPFLLRGLEDPEPRIVANTLETLGEYRDRKLIPFFEVFLVHSVPRVRMNALLAVSWFRRMRGIYRQGVARALDSEVPSWVASALYVVGRRKDPHFLPSVERLLESPLARDRKIQGVLAWALARLGDPRGYERFGTMAAAARDPAAAAAVTHFFGQLPSTARFEAILHLVKRHGGDPGLMQGFARTLRDSDLDFHRELAYLDLLWRSGHEGRQLVDCAA